MQKKLILLFLFEESGFSFSKPHVQLCFHAVIPCWIFVWHHFFIFFFFFLFYNLRDISSCFLPLLRGTYTYSEAQPAVGLGAIFPHPGDTVAHSVCPAEKVMLLSRSERHSSAAATLVELSRPAVLSHQETLAQAAAGSRMEISGKSTRLLCTADLPSTFLRTVSSLRF